MVWVQPLQLLPELAATVTPATSLVLNPSEHDFHWLALVHSRLQLLLLSPWQGWHPVPLTPKLKLGKQPWFHRVSQLTRLHALVASVTQVHAHVLVSLVWQSPPQLLQRQSLSQPQLLQRRCLVPRLESLNMMISFVLYPLNKIPSRLVHELDFLFPVLSHLTHSNQTHVLVQSA